MLYEIDITPAALEDIDVGMKYYNSKADDLGYRFADDIEDNIESIRLAPFAFAKRYNEVRCKLLKTFPYIILYNIQQQQIQILRIFNTYQNPYWE
jgi:plasmid stabilization system protein ParE